MTQEDLFYNEDTVDNKKSTNLPDFVIDLQQKLIEAIELRVKEQKLHFSEQEYDEDYPDDLIFDSSDSYMKARQAEREAFDNLMKYDDLYICFPSPDIYSNR